MDQHALENWMRRIEQKLDHLLMLVERQSGIYVPIDAAQLKVEKDKQQ